MISLLTISCPTLSGREDPNWVQDQTKCAKKHFDIADMFWLPVNVRQKFHAAPSVILLYSSEDVQMLLRYFVYDRKQTRKNYVKHTFFHVPCSGNLRNHKSFTVSHLNNDYIIASFLLISNILPLWEFLWQLFVSKQFRH